jgi:hypothetical protein
MAPGEVPKVGLSREETQRGLDALIGDPPLPGNSVSKVSLAEVAYLGWNSGYRAAHGEEADTRLPGLKFESLIPEVLNAWWVAAERVREEVLYREAFKTAPPKEADRVNERHFAMSDKSLGLLERILEELIGMRSRLPILVPGPPMERGSRYTSDAYEAALEKMLKEKGAFTFPTPKSFADGMPAGKSATQITPGPMPRTAAECADGNYGFAAYRAKADEAIKKMIDEKLVAIEGVTREQTIEAFKQAIACGDFTRLVQAGTDAQSVVYIPFHREQELEQSRTELLNQIDELRLEIERLNQREGELVQQNGDLATEIKRLTGQLRQPLKPNSQ